MRNWILVAFAIMLLCIGSASAAFVTSEFERGSGVASVIGLSGTYVNTCADFSWTANTLTTDQNATGSTVHHYIVRATSNVSDLVEDLNTTAIRYTACTMSPGDWVRIYVYRVDSNSAGIFLNLEPDATAIVTPGTMSQAGLFLVYSMLAAVGGIIALVILVMVMMVVLKKVGFNFSSLMKK